MNTTKRAWLAGILGGATVTAGLLAAGEQPPPYPSVSPVLPAMLPPTPVVPGSEVKPAAATEPIPKNTPVVPSVPSLPAVPTIPAVDTPKPTTPTLEVLPVPSVPSVTPPSVVPPPVVAVPTLTPPAVPTVPAIPPASPPANVAPTPVVPPAAISVPSIPATPVAPKPAETAPAPTPVTTKVVDIPLPTATKPAEMKPAEVKSAEVKPAEVKPVADIRPASAPPETKPAPGTVKISIGATPGVLDNVGKLDAALVESKAAYAKVHDYSCHFIRQERVRGKLTPDVIHELHVRTSPLSIYTKALQPKEFAGVEIVSVAGRFATNQVRFKPHGGTFLTVPADDSRAASGRHPADHVGLAAVLGTIEKMIGTERKLGHPVVATVGAYSYANKPVMRYEIVCEKPHAHRYCHRAVLFVDQDTKLPVRFEAYDEPRGASGPGGDLLESYSFVNLKVNVGHSSAVFDR